MLRSITPGRWTPPAPRLQVFADYARGNVSWLNSTDSRYDLGFIPDNEDRNLTDNLTEIRDLQADFNKAMSRRAKIYWRGEVDLHQSAQRTADGVLAPYGLDNKRTLKLL